MGQQVTFKDRVNHYLNQGGSSILQKALSSESLSGGALIKEHLEEIITDQLIYQAPEYSFIDPVNIDSNIYDFNARYARGNVNRSQGENGVLAKSGSAYKRTPIPLKITAAEFSVTDFLTNSTKGNMDAFAQELETEVSDQILSLQMLNLNGNAVADDFQYTGWDPSIVTHRGTRFDGWDGNGQATVPTDTTVLDDMINASNTRGGSRYQRAFIMTGDMSSKFSRLYDTFRRLIPGEDVMVAGGHRLKTYEGIPILQSTLISGSHSDTMTAVTATSAGTTGGTLSDGTYYFRVVAITDTGPTMASAESSVTLAGATATQQINLDYTAVPNAIAYKVYYSAVSNLSGYSLIRWSPAKTYDGEGTVTGSVETINLLDVTADSSVAGLENDKPPTAVGGINAQSIYLICFDPIQGMGRFAHNNPGERENGLITYDDLAKVNTLKRKAALSTMGAIIPAFEATSVKADGWRPK